MVSGHSKSDGSWESHTEFAQTGKAAYLTMDFVGEVAQNKVEFTLRAGSSQLALTLVDINELVTSGTATLFGTLNGAAVHWTGHADLTSNPFVSRPITGWPAGAFASELQQAALFSPLGPALGRVNSG